MKLLFKLGVTGLGFSFLVLLTIVGATFFLEPGHPFFQPAYGFMVFSMVLSFVMMLCTLIWDVWTDKD